MAKIPRYVKQNLPRAVGTPGVDPSAGREAAAAGQLLGAIGKEVASNFQAQKKIADTATASKLERRAAIEYNKRIGIIKAEQSEDPEKMIQSIQDVGDEIYGDMAEQISSPEIRSSFLNNSNTTIKTQTISAMAWSTKQQGDRARSDTEKAEIGAVLSLGTSSDVNVFNSEAIDWASSNKELYGSVYGKEKGVKNIKSALGRSAEKYIQNQVDDNPFQALNDLDGGKLDKHLSADEKSKWIGRAKSGINNAEKNAVTKTKSSAVIRGSELGKKVMDNSFTAKDIEDEYNSVKDSPNIPQEYKDGLNEWMEQTYKGVKLPLSVKMDNMSGLSKELTEVTTFVSKNDSDVAMDAILKYKAKINKMMLRGQLTEAGFKSLYNDAQAMLDKTAVKVDGSIGGTWSAIGGEEAKEIKIVSSTYQKFDKFLDSEINKATFDSAPKGFKDRVGVDMKVNFNRMTIKREAEKGRPLTSKEYRDVFGRVMRIALDEVNSSIFEPAEVR